MMNANSYSIGNRLKSDLIKEVGLSGSQAAGIVGNLAHESGGFNTLQEIDPLIAGSDGGFGYGQWTGARRKQFMQWAEDQGLDPASYEANKGFLVYELTQTPESKVLDNLKKAQTSDQAAQVFSDEFLRPGIPHMDNRIALAQNFDDGAGDTILMGGEGNDTMTPYERAKAKLMAKQSTGNSDLIAPEATASDRMKDAGETMLRQGLQGATFGFADELTDRMGAGMASLVTGVPYDVLLDEARQTTQQDLERDWEEHPVLSAGSNIAGGVMTGGGLLSAGKTLAPRATGAVLNAAAQSPKTAAFLAGAGGGGLYGAGEAQGPASERLDDFGTGAMWGGPLGVGGYKLAKGIGTAGNAAIEKFGPIVAPYIQKAKDTVAPALRTARGKVDDAVGDLIAPAANQADEITPMKMAGILDEEDLSKLEKGRTIPLTKGDKTQDVRLQRREQIAAESGSEAMINARAKQQEAARKPFKNALGEDAGLAEDIDLKLMEQSEAEKAANILRGKYDDLKARENAAWKTARETGQGVNFKSSTVEADLKGRINQFLKEDYYKPGDVPQVDKSLRELDDILETGSEDGVFYRGVSGQHPHKDLTFWTNDPAEARKYAEGVAYTNDGKDPRVLRAFLKGDKGRSVDDEILDTLMEGSEINGEITYNPDDMARHILETEGLDYVEFSHPSVTKQEDHLVRVIGNRNLIADLGNEKITKLNQLEAWKKRHNALISNTPMDQKDTLRKLKQIGRKYDDFMQNLQEDAIINGDNEAIKAFKEARKLSSERFSLEDSDKVIGKILESRDLQGEQLVNVMMGAEKLLAKGDDGRVLITMLDKAGDKAPEMRDAMKRGIMAKTFRRGIDKNTIDPGSPDQSMVSFAKMRNEIGNLMQKKEVFETLFDQNEQQYMRQFYDDLKFLASKQKGAINSSSTGVWTAEFASGFGKLFNNPLMRSNVGTGMVGNFVQTQAERYAAQQITGKAEKGLAEFFENQINAVNGPAAYYGSIGANSVGADGIADLIGFKFEGEKKQ